MERLRHERWTGQRIAGATGLSRATVSRVLARLKLSRMRDLEPPPVVQRYEHAAPGDLLHLDIKCLVRIARPSHWVTGDRRDRVPASAPSMSMWPSMTIAASPSRPSTRMNQGFGARLPR